MSNSKKVTNHIILYVYVLTTTKIRHLKNTQNIKNNNKNIKSMFLNCYKKHKNVFFTSMSLTEEKKRHFNTVFTFIIYVVYTDVELIN